MRRPFKLSVSIVTDLERDETCWTYRLSLLVFYGGIKSRSFCIYFPLLLALRQNSHAKWINTQWKQSREAILIIHFSSVFEFVVVFYLLASIIVCKHTWETAWTMLPPYSSTRSVDKSEHEIEWVGWARGLRAVIFWANIYVFLFSHYLTSTRCS